MGVQVAFPGAGDLFRREQPGNRQGLQIIERHDVQRQLHRAGQRGGTVERWGAGHGGWGNQE